MNPRLQRRCGAYRTGCRPGPSTRLAAGCTVDAAVPQASAGLPAGSVPLAAGRAGFAALTPNMPR